MADAGELVNTQDALTETSTALVTTGADRAGETAAESEETPCTAASPTEGTRKKKKKKKGRVSYKKFMRNAFKPSKRKRPSDPLVHARFPKLKDRL